MLSNTFFTKQLLSLSIYFRKTNEYNKSRSEINIDLSIIKKLKDAMVRTYEVFIFLYMRIFKKIRYD